MQVSPGDEQNKPNKAQVGEQVTGLAETDQNTVVQPSDSLFAVS
jgi:hypothetical protein